MNQGFVYEERIRSKVAGRSVRDHLVLFYRHSDAAGWDEHLAAGRVRLDGVVATGGEELLVGQQLAYHRAPWEEPSAPLELPVLWEGEQVVVVNKPSGLPTMAGGGFLEHTLVHQLRKSFPAASPMHRLGRYTSGAVICAWGAAGKHLGKQFAQREVTKIYRALVSGRLERDVVCRQPIGPVPYPPLGTLHAASAEGRSAHSELRVLEHRADSTLLDVQIHTGRPHQIRIHTAFLGHPLVGDPLYTTGGVPVVGGKALPGDPGYALHAHRVRFRALGGEEVAVEAPCTTSSYEMVHAPLRTTKGHG